MGRIHGSLSTSTIVSHNGTWKLSDLDCSYQKGAVRDCTEARNCTNCTMAPELVAESLKEDPDGIQALVTQDIWGFGVVLFEMTAQQPLLWQRTSRRVAAWTEMPEDALSALHKGPFTSHASILPPSPLGFAPGLPCIDTPPSSVDTPIHEQSPSFIGRFSPHLHTHLSVFIYQHYHSHLW